MNHSKRCVIGIDIDNVIAATDAKIRDLIRIQYGLYSTQEQITSWNYSCCLPITADQEQFVFDLFHKHYIQNLELLPDVQEIIQNLSRVADIWLITKRPDFTQEATSAWLTANDIPYCRLLYSDDKAEVAEGLRLLVEDNLDTALTLANLGVPVLLMDYPWNRNLKYHPKIIRVHSWKEIQKVVEREVLSFAHINR